VNQRRGKRQREINRVEESGGRDRGQEIERKRQREQTVGIRQRGTDREEQTERNRQRGTDREKETGEETERRDIGEEK
jgi:hypothetical protein